MLVKLLKYELKSTSRIVLYIYGGILAAALLLGILCRFLSGTWAEVDGMNVTISSGDSNGILEIAVFALVMIYIFLITALGVLTFIMIIMRFYNNLLQGEGYLMHTLPVPTWMLVASKLIVALLWNLAALVVIALSGLLIAGISGLGAYILQYVDLAQIWRQIWESVDINAMLIPITVLLTSIVGILEFYFCMSVGNLSSQHKLLSSVGAFVGVQIVTSIASAVIGNRMIVQMNETFSMQPFFWHSIVGNLILAVVFFAGTNWLLSRRLNLA